MELTAREQTIARLITKGKLQKEIADELYISPRTVCNHTVNIMKKWDARSSIDIARKYIVKNPKEFFTALTFLFIQSMIIFNCETMELRRPVRSGSRTVKTARKYE
ncbi:response regulator transcription factor [Leeuwenhoekiella nanhaiensis]|uniref:HTH luxR-type domain-containing protein n=1 Tax=Leeuwenhoekiella nanhaiensis TaxID=1655491 RepID=A0A2G1VM85_9FLAO|nr:LuxR C-terminal-related transcriptional regulator [Leeuwenhoekiella nanhaiensis]PHQ27882.1 hypothetical protein CJ305_17915 [Leeuwenhoekiella nanhaiensis]